MNDKSPSNDICRPIPAPPVVVREPIVSIIIPGVKGLEPMRRCLAALCARTAFPRHEIIVVDDHSVTGAAEFLTEAQTAGYLRVIRQQGTVGFAKACNRAAHEAKGRYLLFLCGDTEVQSNWLEPLVALAEGDFGVAAVGAKLLYADGSIEHAGLALMDCWDHDPLRAFNLFCQEKSDLPLANQRRVYQAVSATCMLARKSCFDQVGGFDEQYWNGCEDVDLCLRFQERGWLTVYEPASVVVHHGASECSPSMAENLERFHRKWLEKVSADVIVGDDGKCRVWPSSAMLLYSRPQNLAAETATLTPGVLPSHAY
jgi:GT2 family glycosyltransferase